MEGFGDDWPAYSWFEPRPDQHDRLDQQTSFVEEKLPGVAFLVGGNGAGTTSAALFKVARFLMETPPPRKDTPFWIIGNDLLQVCETVWKEKLWGNQFLPRDELDMARAKWKDSKQGHALTVPLKPWEGQPGRNWSLEFKSCKQGRDQFQGRSIGGFLFVEQFPWEILQEAIARCREYSIHGSMMAEFTPIDPLLSMRLQEMQENGHPPASPDPSRVYLPKGWKVYRANTACAMEAGHVREEWFHQFFGSMDPAEREVRLTGAWPSFEGQIYPTFNPFVHGISLDDVYCNDGLFPSGVNHRRAIDWGFSAEHAFVCLWGYWYPDTHSWVIYDEYYSTDQRKTVVEHLWSIADRHEWIDGSPYFGATYADPSRQDHIRIASRLNEYPGPEGKTYRRISIQNAANSVYEGIDHIRSQLTMHPIDGKPRLLICRETCPNLWRQMQTYRWVKGSESGLNPRAGAREPLKKDDDAVDALRYLVFTDAKHCKVNIQQLATAPSRAGRSVQFARGGRLQ